MRVLFLGAGASISAKYPPASHLLDVIEKEALQTPISVTKDSWMRFDGYREGARGGLKEVLYSPNPETILSQLDLLLQARSDRKSNWWYRLCNAQDEVAMEALRRDPHPHDDEPRELSKVPLVIRALEDLIDNYFSRMHWEDHHHRPSQRDYLRRELRALNSGDVILTTNWDTLPERTLSELGLWYPLDGYGLNAPLQPYGLRRPELQLRELRSKVLVLKLHGSVGWHHLPRRHSWYLRYANFLQFLPIQVGDERVRLEDPRESERPYGFHEPRVLIRPSYLKSLNSPVLQEIWRQAVDALRSANQVKIIGYSLPDSDGAVRALLIPLRNRLEREDVQATVVNPDRKALERWKELLGERATLIEQKFGGPESSA